jgi:hypothetical protein
VDAVENHPVYYAGHVRDRPPADEEDKMGIFPVTRSDFAFTQPNSLSLPTFSNFAPVPYADVSCTLPADALLNGIIAFTYATDPTHDSSVDIHFTMDSPGVHWGLGTTLQEFRGMHWAVALTPGQKNTFTFAVDKAGTIVDQNNVPHPFGGAGTVYFQNILVCSNGEIESRSIGDGVINAKACSLETIWGSANVPLGGLTTPVAALPAETISSSCGDHRARGQLYVAGEFRMAEESKRSRLLDFAFAWIWRLNGKVRAMGSHRLSWPTISCACFLV